jgi:uncharacterized protein with GYD domain
VRAVQPVGSDLRHVLGIHVQHRAPTADLGSRYDFVSISEYPTAEAAFESRIKHIELGILDRFEYYEAFDMDLFLAKV